MLKAFIPICVLFVACEPSNQGYEPIQPIAFSHAMHAGSMQIPCQYCHYAAERGRNAGIPPVSTCMNCHQQVQPNNPEIAKIKAALANNQPISWVRVHQVPDHVYFEHRAHVRAGVACQDCHGPVEQMAQVRQWAPLSMGWCVDCHRERGAGHHDTTGFQSAGPTTDCGVCHH